MNKILDFIENTQMMKYVMFSMYVIINLLFVVKYGVKQDLIPTYILIILFILSQIFILIGYDYFLKKIKISNTLVYSTLFLSTVFYIFLCHIIKDPYQLKIDRWQTIEYSLNYWIHGEYIYDTKNFMGNVSSYLPGQLLFLVGFYLLGNVGYIQVASLLLFSCAIIWSFKNNTVRFYGIVLLTISLSFLYEAVCKSDFISSFIITTVFILLWHKKFEGNYFEKSVLLGFILGVICLTRSVVVIPLILFLFRPFWEAAWKQKIKFIASFSLTAGILLASVLLPAENFEFILKHNPLKMQGQSNIFVVVFFLLLSVFFSFYIKNIKQVFNLSAIIIFCLMGDHILEQLIKGYDSKFLNITYLAAALPFCIISYCFLLKSNIEDGKI
ncbi:hypothetical protein [Chryseobacterium sp.]|uniref:hypothetical protein n=1 Tax=Chryseobacterium sp. TaxID=1871047 RepID=UPI0011C8BFF0|nr:hypothetical protein [Chryseobacterium sp.]TXF75009.1 hypothetical protein FUA25_12070 [Chryseobacterium sp.]